jgi:hypothetical protein
MKFRKRSEAAEAGPPKEFNGAPGDRACRGRYSVRFVPGPVGAVSATNEREPLETGPGEHQALASFVD